MHEATGSPIAAEALRCIAELYAIEASINGRTVEQRQQVRNVRTRPLIEAMKPWLENELMRIPSRGVLAIRIRYALARWDELSRFLNEGASISTPIPSNAADVIQASTLAYASCIWWRDVGRKFKSSADAPTSGQRLVALSRHRPCAARRTMGRSVVARRAGLRP